MYLDYAENQAARQIPMKMNEWIYKLDAFLQFNEYDILKDAVKVSHEVAIKLAGEEYETSAGSSTPTSVTTLSGLPQFTSSRNSTPPPPLS